MGPATLQTALGEHPPARDAAARETAARPIKAGKGSEEARRVAKAHRGQHSARQAGASVHRLRAPGGPGVVLKCSAMKVAVLGAGAWGAALAQLLAEKGDDVVLWARREELCEAVNAAHENARYLPGVTLSANVRATTSIPGALGGAQMIVFSVVPSHATREVAREAAPHVREGVLVVSATKGIENESLVFMDEVLAQELPAHARRFLAFLSGPSFARELANKLPTAVVIAAHDADAGSRVMHQFHTPYLRTYASNDVVGVECGGALKNVIAIAAGAVDGMGFGHNTRAALYHARASPRSRSSPWRAAARRSPSAGLAGHGRPGALRARASCRVTAPWASRWAAAGPSTRCSRRSATLPKA